MIRDISPGAEDISIQEIISLGTEDISSQEIYPQAQEIYRLRRYVFERRDRRR